MSQHVELGASDSLRKSPLCTALFSSDGNASSPTVTVYETGSDDVPLQVFVPAKATRTVTSPLSNSQGNVLSLPQLVQASLASDTDTVTQELHAIQSLEMVRSDCARLMLEAQQNVRKFLERSSTQWQEGTRTALMSIIDEFLEFQPGINDGDVRSLVSRLSETQPDVAIQDKAHVWTLLYILAKVARELDYLNKREQAELDSTHTSIDAEDLSAFSELSIAHSTHHESAIMDTSDAQLASLAVLCAAPCSPQRSLQLPSPQTSNLIQTNKAHQIPRRLCRVWHCQPSSHQNSCPFQSQRLGIVDCLQTV
eukprot:m.302726 g.302726  ORF g.302726 m.302726 type:complete len:310 (-) comp15887_c0_seq2:2464-3393(-)